MQFNISFNIAQATVDKLELSTFLDLCFKLTQNNELMNYTYLLINQL